MPPVPGRDAAAPIHYDLILPVGEDGHDHPSLVPLGGPDHGLVLDPNIVSDHELG